MIFFKSRIHESVAVAAIIAAAVALHGLWVVNLLITRLPSVGGFFYGFSEKSAVPSLYMFGLLLFLVVWCVLSFVFKGRDCSHHRESAFWFFAVSSIIFFVMTMPMVFGFSM